MSVKTCFCAIPIGIGGKANREKDRNGQGIEPWTSGFPGAHATNTPPAHTFLSLAPASTLPMAVPMADRTHL